MRKSVYVDHSRRLGVGLYAPRTFNSWGNRVVDRLANHVNQRVDVLHRP
jgi:hypothetical protein